MAIHRLNTVHKIIVTQTIKITNLSLIYPNGHQALKDVNLELHQGNVYALIGMNGSGKSTLFKSILNLEQPTTGDIEILGSNISQAIKQQQIAYVPQADQIDYDFPISVEEVIMQGRYGHMGMRRKPSTTDHELLDKALTLMQLQDLRKRQIGQLSGGQKKRVFIARALIQQAQIILLDEPFTGVDITTENQIIELLPELAKQGKTILVSTHNLDRVPEYCNQTVFLYRTVLTSGATQEVFTSYNLERTFNPTLK